MEIGLPYTNLNERNPKSTFALAREWSSVPSKAEYRDRKYENPVLATPVLQPVKGKIAIPPLEGFPSPAIPVNSDSLFNLNGNSK